MNDERDALLGNLFAAAEQRLEDDVFVTEVMAQARAVRRRHLILALAVSVAAIPAVWLIATPLNDLLLRFLELAAQPVTTTAGWVGTILSPLNSLASLLALGLLATRALYRRFAR